MCIECWSAIWCRAILNLTIGPPQVLSVLFTLSVCPRRYHLSKTHWPHTGLQSLYHFIPYAVCVMWCNVFLFIFLLSLRRFSTAFCFRDSMYLTIIMVIMIIITIIHYIYNIMNICPIVFFLLDILNISDLLFWLDTLDTESSGRIWTSSRSCHGPTTPSMLPPWHSAPRGGTDTLISVIWRWNLFVIYTYIHITHTYNIY